MAAALAITEQMLALARTGAWAEVMALDNQRTAVVSRLPMADAERLELLRTRNDELLALAEAARGQIQGDLTKLARQREASSAYSST
jgi:hypothetical protein